MKQDRVKQLLLQSLEHERRGMQVYETALKCVSNDEFEEELQKYLDQTAIGAARVEQASETGR